MLVSTGCVGTLQEAARDYANVVVPNDEIPQFAGIAQLVPIADTRLEVFFYPAVGGTGKYTYDVLIGSNPAPISFPSDVLTPDYRGLLKVTLKNLTRLNSYQVKVEVRNENATVSSASNVVKTAMTFDNQVADFDGITAAFNMAGQDGKDSIKIRWTPARISGGIIKQPWDPKLYEVIVVDASRLSPSDMDANFLPSQGKWTYSFNHADDLNEYVVRGLPANKRFYVRMRCLHETSENNVYNPRMRSELNTKYVEISTLSDSLADLKFEPSAFAVALSPGEQGLTSIQTTWTQAVGVFDHYRLYYSLVGGGVSSGFLPDLCLTPATSPNSATIFCKTADITASSAPITGLDPYSNYEVALVLCQTSQCTAAERLVGPFRVILTDPAFPSFAGVKTVTKAATLEDLGTLLVTFDTPNFTTGYVDGLILRMRRTVDGSDAEVVLDSTMISNVYYDHYEYVSDTKITVNNIDYLSEQPYCFSLTPFKYDTDGVTKREVPNNVWKCMQPSIVAPTALEFRGLATASTSFSTVSLTWDKPSNGIFEQYEIFYRKGSTSFTWGDAIAQAGNGNFTNYGRRLINSSQLGSTIASLPDGVYTFGVLAYFSYVTDGGPVVIRSETNNNLLRCTVDSTNDEIVACIP
jgi:hypothetical protein